MQKVAITAVALLSFSSVAWAETASVPLPPPRPIELAQGSAAMSGQAAPQTPTPTAMHSGDRFVRNASGCGGDPSRPVRRNGAIIGYSCISPNGG